MENNLEAIETNVAIEKDRLEMMLKLAVLRRTVYDVLQSWDMCKIDEIQKDVSYPFERSFDEVADAVDTWTTELIKAL